jgi:hypothetical protein
VTVIIEDADIADFQLRKLSQLDLAFAADLLPGIDGNPEALLQRIGGIRKSNWHC